MSESETRFEKFSGNMKKWRQHEKNGDNMTEREPTYNWIIVWEMNIQESS